MLYIKLYTNNLIVFKVIIFNLKVVNTLIIIIINPF